MPRLSELTTRTWLLPTEHSWRTVSEALRQAGRVRAQPPTSSLLELYDNFEWSLYFGSRTLVRKKRGLELHGNATLHVADLPEGNQVPRFWWQLEPSALRAELARLGRLRALLPIGALRMHERSIKLENRERKTVARLLLQTATPPQRPRQLLQRKLIATAVRGYESALQPLADALLLLGAKEMGPKKTGTGEFAPVEADGGLVEVVLQQYQHHPQRYSSKPSLEITATTPLRDAITQVLRSALAIARRNEEGARTDLDTEFVHHYRTSLRRMRSYLSLLGEALPERARRQLARRLRGLAGRTGHLRDLDVLLLDAPELRKPLPESLRDGFDELFGLWTRERDREQARLCRWLASEAYGREIAHVQTLVDALDQLPPTAVSEQSASTFAAAALRHRLRRFHRHAQALAPGAANSRLHRLRIDGKKIRYLLELFSDALDSEALAELLPRLRRLQDELGHFNDLCVRLGLFDALAADNRAKVSRAGAVALGGLLTLLHQDERDTRSGAMRSARRVARLARRAARELRPLIEDRVVEPAQPKTQ